MAGSRKSFAYVVRTDGPAPRLLVLQSLDESGCEVPKGTVEQGETYEQAALREVLEEAGIDGIWILREIGVVRYQGEEQHALLAIAPDGLPEAFEHRVTGTGVDAGFRYAFHWEPIDRSLRERLVQGCDAFVDALLDAVPDALPEGADRSLGLS